jgi:hypothetical protein
MGFTYTTPSELRIFLYSAARMKVIKSAKFFGIIEPRIYKELILGIS